MKVRAALTEHGDVQLIFEGDPAQLRHFWGELGQAIEKAEEQRDSEPGS